MEFLFDSALVPFVFSLILVFGFLFLEIISVILVGFSFLNSHAWHFDFEHDTGFMSWLGFGKVPFMVVLVLLLTFFGLIGLGLQGMVRGLLGFSLNSIIAIPISFAISFPLVAFFSKRLGRVIKDVETQVQTEDDFIGQTAVMLGEVKKDRPSQAKFIDKNGHAHYVMIKVENDDVIKEGESVVIRGRANTDSPFFLVSNK